MSDLEAFRISGWLRLKDQGDSMALLFVSACPDEPLAEILQEKISKKFVTARYWVTDQESSLDEAKTKFLEQLYGIARCDYGAHYSETTGYLWTDEAVNVGGHDLIKELKSYIGKWLTLEIDIHEKRIIGKS